MMMTVMESLFALGLRVFSSHKICSAALHRKNHWLLIALAAPSVCRAGGRARVVKKQGELGCTFRPVPTTMTSYSSSCNGPDTKTKQSAGACFPKRAPSGPEQGTPTPASTNTSCLNNPIHTKHVALWQCAQTRAISPCSFVRASGWRVVK